MNVEDRLENREERLVSGLNRELARAEIARRFKNRRDGEIRTWLTPFREMS